MTREIEARAAALSHTLAESAAWIAAQLRAGNARPALAQYQDWLSGVETLEDALQLLLGSSGVATSRAETWVALRPHLVAMSQALEQRDLVQVADILEYEMRPALQRWEWLLGEDRG